MSLLPSVVVKAREVKKTRAKAKRPKNPLLSGSKKTFGDADGRHEVDDYADEAIAIITVLIG